MIFLGFLFSECSAEQADTTYLNLRFSQSNRTYVWNNQLNFSHIFDNRMEVNLFSQINSTLIKSSIFSGGGNRWQEDGGLKVGLSYPLNRNLSFGFNFSQEMNSLGDRKVTTDGWGLVSLFKWWKATLSQQVGIKKFENKRGEGKLSDQGLSYDLSLAIQPTLPKAVKSDICLKQGSVDYKNIPSIERSLELSLFKRLNSDDSLKFFYQEGWSKKKYYAYGVSSQKSTQKRNVRTINWDSSKNIIWNLKLDLNLDYSLNKYRYVSEEDTLIFPLSLKDNATTSQEIDFQLKRDYFQRIRTTIFYKYNSSLEEYWDRRRNQKMESGEIGTNLDFGLTSSDSLYLVGSVGVTSIYSLSIFNFNDRDVLLKMLNLEYIHLFSPFLILRTKAGFRNFHQLYMSERLSNNNNYNETYLLSPTVEYRPHPKIYLKQDFSIQANYISYDYRKELESTDNKIFRRASSSTELNYYFSPKLDLLAGYFYRYEDYGQLLWKDQWVEKVSWDRRTERIKFGCSYHLAKQLVFSPDYVYEIRREWNHLWDIVSQGEVRRLGNKLIRNVLSFSLSYYASSSNLLEISGSTQFQKTGDNNQEKSNFLSISLIQFF
jgi:hypothetical protein